MPTKFTLFFLSLITFCQANNLIPSADQEYEISPVTIRARYRTPKGVGYTSGYSTLELCLAPKLNMWFPFIDARGHVFDNGKLAANAGVGLRYMALSRMWGINAYYDYRNTTHQHYNQVAMGLESLGKNWDVRVNGYLPVGWKQSPFYHISSYGFAGNSYLLQYDQEFALKGANAEAGWHVDYFKEVPIYFAAGPYYLTGSKETTWGGELRTSAEFFHRYLRLEANVSYDHLFKWIGQAQIGINIPLGRRKSSHSQNNVMNIRAKQRVDRNEIIPVSKKHIIKPAINPATGESWVFWFVDNTSHSAGTFENPFSTLLDAQRASLKNDIIYIFPGDGTTNGLSSGLTLKDSQQLCGASYALTIPTTLGQFTIAPTASSSPYLTNTTGSGNIVTLSNNNMVAGLNFITSIDSSNSLYGNGITNLTVKSNTLTSPTSMTTNGITLVGSSGQIVVSNTAFNSFTNNDSSNNGNSIYIDSGTLNTLSVTNSYFNNIINSGSGSGGCGIFCNGPIPTFTSSGNTFDNLSNGAIAINIMSSITNFTSTGDTYNNLSANSIGIYNNSSSTNFTLSNNTFSNITSGGAVYIGDTINTFSSSDNTFTNLNNSYGIAISGGPINTLISTGDIFNNLISSSRGVVIGAPVTNLTCSGDTFNNIYNQSTGIYVLDSVTTFIFSGNIFNDISYNFSSGMQSIGSINTLISSGNNFNNIDSGGFGIFSSAGSITTLTSSRDTFNNINNYSIYLNGMSTSITIDSDTFKGGSAPIDGFATTITTTGGSLCLDFTQNTATPSTVTKAYVFSNSGGTFNSTATSTTTNNIGLFDIGAGVNFPGTCTP